MLEKLLFGIASTEDSPHDLRAPLSSILWLIQISEKSSDVKEIREYLHLMKGSLAFILQRKRLKN